MAKQEARKKAEPVVDKNGKVTLSDGDLNLKERVPAVATKEHEYLDEGSKFECSPVVLAKCKAKGWVK